MRLYTSSAYTNFDLNQYSRNLFMILSDEERFRLSDKIYQLETDIKIKLENGTLENAYLKDGVTLKKQGGGLGVLVQKDYEAIEFLKRMTHFTDYSNSEMIDPTSHQISTIVEKMLAKVYRKDFYHWMEMWIDPIRMDILDMKDWMDRKRSIFHQMKREGLLDESFEIRY